MFETSPTKFFSLLCLTASIFVFELFSQNGNPGRRPPMREHTTTKSGELKLIPSVDKLPFKPLTKFKKSKSERTVESNAIPEHKVGAFPSRGNPNKVREQALKFTLPLNPTPAKEPIPLHNDSGRGPPNTPFGIALNGVLFDPGTAEFYMGDRRADWNYEALGGAVFLGLDENHGHVQPNGSYHYHGLPTAFLQKLRVSPRKHSPMIGYAMDGYPIYALYGYKDPEDSKSGIKKLPSSFQLKKGYRPNPPGGKYDGTFSKDYEYVKGSGDLDECNGRFTVTKEFPEGTYAYFLTANWPVIPRYFKAEPLRLRGMRRPRQAPPFR